jgi:hypothetical protein
VGQGNPLIAVSAIPPPDVVGIPVRRPLPGHTPDTSMMQGASNTVIIPGLVPMKVRTRFIRHRHTLF